MKLSTFSLRTLQNSVDNLKFKSDELKSRKNFSRRQKTILDLLRCVFCCLTIFVTTIQMTFAQPETNAVKSESKSEAPAIDAKSTADSKSADVKSELVSTKQEAANLGAKNKEFMTQYEKYAEIIKKLTKLKVEYVNAEPVRAVEIDKEYDSLITEGTKIGRDMIDAGIEAYVEAPNKSIFVNNFLFSMLVWEFNRDNFEIPVKIFKSIISKGIPADAGIMYVYAGLSAILTCDFDEAAEWLKIAKENKSFEQYLKTLQSTKPKKAGEQMSHEQIMARNFIMWSEKIPEMKADWEKEKNIRSAETEANKDPKTKLPRVELKTSKGKIVLELFENEAPNSVANFISLVEKKYYNGTKFHRVLPCFMAQGGDNGMGGPGYKINDECKTPNARKHFRGSLSMANAGPNTNGSQFFLTFVKTDHLDGGHTVFGRVVEGIDVLADIQRVDPSDTESSVGNIDEIIEANVINKRDHPYEPIKR